jgi:hypothetical protein
MHLLAGMLRLDQRGQSLSSFARLPMNPTLPVLWFNPKNSNRPRAERTPLGRGPEGHNIPGIRLAFL